MYLEHSGQRGQRFCWFAADMGALYDLKRLTETRSQNLRSRCWFPALSFPGRKPGLSDLRRLVVATVPWHQQLQKCIPMTGCSWDGDRTLAFLLLGWCHPLAAALLGPEAPSDVSCYCILPRKG